MLIARSRLCVVYGLVAILALLATWKQNLHYLSAGTNPLAAFVSATTQFSRETFATPASVSITVDLLLFVLAVMVWMVLESRRLGIRFVWAYVVFGFLIAISVTFPLFLIARERRLATLGQVSPAIRVADALGLAAVGIPIVAISVWTLFD